MASETLEGPQLDEFTFIKMMIANKTRDKELRPGIIILQHTDQRRSTSAADPKINDAFMYLLDYDCARFLLLPWAIRFAAVTTNSLRSLLCDIGSIFNFEHVSHSSSRSSPTSPLNSLSMPFSKLLLTENPNRAQCRYLLSYNRATQDP